MSRPWVLAAIGLTAFAATVWFAGPWLVLGGQAPLASPSARALLAALFITQYLAHKAWAARRARRGNERLLAALTPALDAAAQPELAQLQQRFTAALEQLRDTRFGARGGHWSALSWKFGRRYVYQLPWYLIIGAPGAGKTTALLNSGLTFPLSAKLGRAPVAGFGGTRYCDWWFTDSAVLIDTAGRYTTQDSDPGADAQAWQGFLTLLRTSRPRRPINGVLVAVSVGDLQSFSAAQLADHAQTLRARLDELQASLGVRPPVYLLITKCDLLPGFLDWFGAVERGEREAVWGVTFAVGGAGALDAAAQFPSAFDDLVNRLADRLVPRLEAERDPVRRGRIFSLSTQVRALGEPLAALVTAGFGASPKTGAAPAAGATGAFLRGVYLTSGSQEGTPIDRIVSALGRELGLEQHVLPPNQNTGKSFFLSRLLSDVVLSEAELRADAPLRQRWQRRAVFGCIALVQLAALTVAALWLASYRHALADIARLDARVAQMQSLAAALPSSGEPDPRPVLPALDAARSLAQTELPPVPPGTALDVGRGARAKLRAAARDAYTRLLLGALQQRMAAAVERTLRSGADMNLQYEALKAYAMLTAPARYDAAGLKVFVTSYWNTALMPPLNDDERARLETHLDALLQAGVVGSGLVWQPALVESVRMRLAAQSPVQRIALRMNLLLAAHPAADFALADLGPAAGLFTSDTAPVVVPGRDTIEVYRDVVRPQAALIAARLSAETPWVLGTAPGDAAADAEQFLAAYRTDYALEWVRFVDALKFNAATKNADALRQLKTLASSDGPLAALLSALARQTPLQLSDGAPGPIAPTDPAAGQFAALANLLVIHDGVPAVSADLTRLLEELRALRTPDGEPTAGTAQARAARLVRLRLDAQRQPAPLRAMVTSLAVLPPDQVTVPAGDTGTLTGQIAARLGAPCIQLVAGRFPFDRRATRDASLHDFAKVFGPKGAFATAFDQLAAGRIDSSGGWSGRGGAAPLERDVERFRAAARIREVFFTDQTDAPSLELSFVPVDMDQDIDRFALEIDGQSVNYAHGPELATRVSWPGAKSGVRLSVTPAGGGSALEYSGPWALFRLLDHAAIQESGTPGRMTVVFDVNGRHATFSLSVGSHANPFRLTELEHVDCPIGAQ